MALYNQGDIINEFLARMNVSTTVGFYSDERLTRWASNAHNWAASFKKWPMTEGRYSTTAASLTTSEDGYTRLNYPEGFRQDSIRLLTIDGKRFQKMNFYKFQSFVQDNSNNALPIFTDYMRQVFINPSAPGISGSVVAWGQYNPAPLASDNNIQDPSALTIFSGVEEDGNEAIVEKMMEYAFQRERREGEDPDAHGKKAATILTNIWARIGDEQAMYQTPPDDGMFKRFDVVRGGMRDSVSDSDQFPIM